MLEEGRIPEGMLPEGESEFSRESEDKNFTKVVIDTEHNKAFLTEMAEKLKNINSEEDAEKLKNIFKTMTGVDYDELCKQNEEKELAEDEMPPKELPPEPVPLPEEKPTDDGLDEKVIEEPPKELSLTEREYHEKTINQLDEYLQNPEKLKFTDDEIAEMRQLGVFDRETLIVLVEQLHEDIDNIIAGETDPFSIYFDPEVRKKAIKDTLEIKVSAQEAIDASKDLINSGAVQKVFESKFPKYTARGPAAIMEEFLEYLNRRTVTENECQFLYHELNSTKKLKEIIDNANEKLFENMKTTDGKPFTVSHFVGNIFRWNRSRLALLTGIEEN
jgi:hypothetical protein